MSYQFNFVVLSDVVHYGFLFRYNRIFRFVPCGIVYLYLNSHYCL